MDPRLACARYFGRDVAEAVVEEVAIEWAGPRSFCVMMDGVDFAWEVRLTRTPATRAMNTVGRLLPERLWRNDRVLALMGAAAGRALGAGRVALHGRVSNGQRFVANPRLIWAVEEGKPSLAGADFGPPGPLAEQARLGDFWIPQRGLVAFGQALFEPFDPARHSAATSQRAGPVTG